MKYRTKLIFSFVSIAILSSILALGIVYFYTKQLLFQDLRSKVLTVASTAAASLDGENFKNLDNSSVANSEAYKDAKAALQKIRNANQRKDFSIKYIYTYQPSKTDPGQFAYSVDADDDAKTVTNLGKTVKDANLEELKTSLNTPFANKEEETDNWGTWLSAFAPIYDKEGHYVATLAVDLSSRRVNLEITRIVMYGLLALGASVIFALIVGVTLAHFTSKSLATLVGVVHEIGEGHLECKAHLETKDEFNDLADAINEMTDGLEERERIKASFAKYVSAQVLDKILQTGHIDNLEGERRKITVLFSDIRDFTTLAERLPPEQVVLHLNEYFDKMIDVIFKNYGTLDKFIGDGLMVEFGAPLADALQEEHAALTAIDMMKALEELNKYWKKAGRPTLRIGIGINSGAAIVGNIGSIKRMEYTAIGDTVNVASRLEQATKELKQPILLSESTYLAIKDHFPCAYLGQVSVPGRQEPIGVYTLLAERNHEEKS